MGKTSRKANKGKDYRTWHSSSKVVWTPSRQRHRAALRDIAFAGMSGENILADENGFIPRRKRREMARFLANQRWRSRNAQ